ncbi:MAG: S9 family peptidase [Pirellulales bacterium]|nr:S9 family peptidase [Pirellulales bacterium]
MTHALRFASVLGLLLVLITAVGAMPARTANAQPPKAQQRPHVLKAHGHERIDPYYWLRDRDDQQVISYLEAENAYLKTQMVEYEAFENKLFEETKARIKQDDSSVPYQDDGYWYYRRFEEGKQYPLFCRSKSRDQSDEQVMLDVNQLAQGHDYCAVRGTTVSTDRNLLAFAVDYVGRRKYTMRIKNLATGEIYPDEIADVTGSVAWANDNQTLFYTRQDPQTLRSYRVFRHQLGSDPAADKLIYEEKDETFRCGVFKTRSKQFIMIGSSQTLSDEYRFLDADDPLGEFGIVEPRQRNLEYSVDHLGDHFYIRTNLEAENFRLVKAPVDSPQLAHWEEIIPQRDGVYLQGVTLFENFLVTQEREQGLIQIRVRPWEALEGEAVDFGEPTYTARVGQNPQVSTDKLRYTYTSMTTPSSVYEYDMKSGTRTLLKQDPVLGGFDSENYVTERLWATARDGVQVPISLVYRKGTPLDGSAPLMLYGYGSYGSSMDASFSSDRLNLIDRGFIYAIAHIRGGQEMGRQWYEGGKLLEKKNTFTDFIDAAEHLIASNYANPRRIFARGGSAGGLLIGAVINMRPDLFTGVVADVPFVDVVTTMLDDSIPLTTNEYDEWGNPNVKEYYDYMLSYSPYDNVGRTDYPHILVTTGLHDSQVQYWEPAKWVARLRELKTDDHLLLLKTNMSAGHGGASGRFSRLKEIAFRHTFILRLAGIRE